MPLSRDLGKIDGKAPLTSANVINTAGLTAFPATYIRGLYYVALNAGGTGVDGSPAPAVPNGTNLTGYHLDLTKFLGKGDNSPVGSAAPARRTPRPSASPPSPTAVR